MRQDIPQLHAIRSLAMTAIFFHHLWQGSTALRAVHAHTLLDTVGMDMALGVVVFNVMTAFLMGLALFGDGPVPAFGPYVRKRLIRLCPQYYLAVLGLTAASVAVFRLTDWPGIAWAVLSHLLFLDTFQVAPFYGNMAAFWWLGLLIQWTVCFPWLARRLTRPGPGPGPGGWCLGAAAILWPVTAWVQARGAALPGTGWETLAFLWAFNLPARLPELLCGVWMAKAWREGGGGLSLGRGPLGFVGAGCLLALAAEAIPGAPSLGHMTGAVWTLAVFTWLFSLPAVARLGGWPGLRLVSRLSYGIYLCHQPLLSFCGPLTQDLPPWPRFWLTAGLAGGASLIGAVALARVADWLTGRLGLGENTVLRTG